MTAGDKKTYTIEHECASLQVGVFPDDFIHAPDHPDHDANRIDACTMKRRLNGVVIRERADDVLEKLPKYKWVAEPSVKTDPENRSPDPEHPDLIVKWFYQGVTLTFARGYIQDPMFGPQTAYAVQKIEPNNLVKSTKKASNKKRFKGGRRR